MIDENKLMVEIAEWRNQCMRTHDLSNATILNTVLEIIENQPKVNEWIPCDEKLPENGQYVLVTLNNEVVICDSNFIELGVNSSNNIGIEVVKFQRSDNEYINWVGSWGSYENDQYKTEVLAWMPLPKSY